MAEVWVVDDDASVRFVLAAALREAGHGVEEFDRAEAALQAFDSVSPGQRPALVFTDVRMPGDDGLKLLEAIRSRAPDLPVVVMSAYTDIASTAGAFRGGALEFLSKPFDLDVAVALAARLPGVAQPDQPGHAAAQAAPTAAALLGNTPAMQALFRAIGRVAQTSLNVLITGETGTGKELVARAIHAESPRARGPFIAINTAAVPSELLESELFGHEAGAFTGAHKRGIGRFEQASGGTLFLDEIGDMPASLQTRLLRVLAEGEFFRVGGRELVRADARIIAATHQPLDALTETGRFRADLLHRLDVVRLALPPLRERREDIPLLADAFLAQAARTLGVAAKQFTPAAMRALKAHGWPGNVRELENLCRRVSAMAPGARIGAEELQLQLSPARSATGSDWTQALARWTRERIGAGAKGIHAEAREQFEHTLLRTALEHTGGQRSQAAALLGLGRNTVGRWLTASPKPPPGNPGA